MSSIPNHRSRRRMGLHLASGMDNMELVSVDRARGRSRRLHQENDGLEEAGTVEGMEWAD